MKIRSFFLICLVFACQILYAREVKQYTIEQFLQTINLQGASFSASEERIAFTSNKNGIYNIYSMPIAGGEITQLTDEKESTFLIGYFPHDDRILFSQDRGGDENTHLYVRFTDGTIRDLTPGEKTKSEFLKWSYDGTSFYYISNETDPKYFDLYRVDAKTFERWKIFENKAGMNIHDISNDEQFIALSKTESTVNSDIYIYSTISRDMKIITPHKGEVSFRPLEFDPTSRFLYFLTDEGSEFTYLQRINIYSGKRETIERTNWDIMFALLSRRGKYMAVAVNEDAHTKLVVYETGTKKSISLPKFAEGDITEVCFSRSENRMAFYVNGDRSPNNLYIYDFQTQKIQKLTNSLSPQIDPEDLVEPLVVRYRSSDGMEIPALLYKPHQADENNRAAALIWVHGGPGGQSRKGYSPLIQYLVNHGYVVLSVNNRGSSGYGKTFFTADDQKHGREPLYDCIAGKKYLASLNYVDASKIGIIGGSYGGYMVLAALTLTPEEFDVGVDIFGISNWVRTLESIPPYWESFRKALYKEIGDPVKQKEMLREISPVFHADKIVKPLLVLQGKNDPRVLQQESDDIVNSIRKRYGIVEYLVFEDEGHGFTKKKNQIAGYKTILDFLNRYLKGNKHSAP